MNCVIKQLKGEVNTAFGWRSYPVNWEITSESILNEYQADLMGFMSGLSEEGFVYYLPAFLKLSLNFDDPIDIVTQLTFKLTFPGSWPPAARHLASTELQDLFLRMAALLTPRERRAVVHILEFLEKEYAKHHYPPETNSARIALDSYWAHVDDGV